MTYKEVAIERLESINLDKDIAQNIADYLSDNFRTSIFNDFRDDVFEDWYNEVEYEQTTSN